LPIVSKNPAQVTRHRCKDGLGSHIHIDGFSNNQMTVAPGRDHDRSSVDNSVQFALVGALGGSLQCAEGRGADAVLGCYEPCRFEFDPGSCSSGLIEALGLARNVEVPA